MLNAAISGALEGAHFAPHPVFTCWFVELVRTCPEVLDARRFYVGGRRGLREAAANLSARFNRTSGNSKRRGREHRRRRAGRLSLKSSDSYRPT